MSIPVTMNEKGEFVVADVATAADTLLILQGLQMIDARLTRIESKIAEYEPLIELVRSKVDRGASWRKRKDREDG